ncbi:MAG: hypothetical protein IT373_21160 [Polyangiaceae bacterium]|nr:hypothetical protein [Polyangiaceae bacterium]
MNWFVCLPVSPGAWFAPLLETLPRRVLRPFAPEDLHATVAFLGKVGEDAARDAWEAVRPLAAGRYRAPLRGTLGVLRPMGNPRRFSALSATFEQGAELLGDLVGELRGPAYAAANARPDDRPPLAHVTIARPPRDAGERERRIALAWAEEQGPIGAEVELATLALYTWSENRAVRQFRSVAEVSLVAGAAEPER